MPCTWTQCLGTWDQPDQTSERKGGCRDEVLAGTWVGEKSVNCYTEG
jgi:hypothetical protein